MRTAILCTAAASWYLLGLGVTVAAVVYPSFGVVTAETWSRFHEQHSRRISFAVGGAWIAQAAGLVWWLTTGISFTSWCFCAGGALAAVLVTAGWAVAIHQSLATGQTPQLLHRLRLVHYIRTGCWVLSSVAALVALR